MVEPNDDDGHVVARVFAIPADGFCTAHVKNLLAKLAEDQLVPLRGVRVESLADVGNHVGIAHRVPDAIRADDDEFPLAVQVKGLDLGHDADHLLPRRLLHLGF